MSKKIKLTDLEEFDVAKNLQTEEDIATYLTLVLEENDPDEFNAALNDVARARGMMAIAKESGLAREALYRSLRKGSKARFDTIHRVCLALGVQLVATPLHTSKSAAVAH